MEYKLLPIDERMRNQMLSDPEYVRDFSHHVETPFEGRMVGGTPDNMTYLKLRGNTIEDYHIPVSVLGNGEQSERNISIEEANLIREAAQFRVLTAMSLSFCIDLRTGKLKEDKDIVLNKTKLAVSLEPLDSNGVTVRDPRILGVWDEETQTYHEIPGRDLTKEYYDNIKGFDETHPVDPNDKLSDFNEWHYVRDGRTLLESESSGEPEKE